MTNNRIRTFPVERFTRCAAVACLAGLIGGCGSGDTPGQASENYFERLDAAVALVRTSPDHRPASRERIVASGDTEAAIRFVRESFRVMPDSLDGYMQPVAARRWGPAGALRSGMGTPRDLADLLQGMLVEMGYDARIVAYRFARVRDPHAYTPPEFTPERPPSTLGPPLGPRPPEPVPIRGADSEALARSVLAAIPPGRFAPRLVADFPPLLPTVQFEGPEGLAIADLWSPDGGIRLIDRALPDAPSRDVASVTVRLRTLTVGEPGAVTVAELTAGIDRLLGRQVHARFAPAANAPLELIHRAPEDFDVFLPTLFVPGADDLAVTGTPIDIAGNRYESTFEGLSVGRGRITDTGDPRAIATVEILRVDTSRFPDVEITARVSDAGGNSLPGVPASAFQLQADGMPGRARLLSNAAAPPRILFLVDGSGSVPEAYRGVGAGQVVQAVAEGILGQIPDAEFRVTVENNGEASARSPWTSDAESLAAPARAFMLSSALWEAYADASERYAPDVIVMTTDGVSVTKAGEPVTSPPPGYERRLRSAAPAIMLGSGELGPAFEGIATLTGGVALPIENQAEGIAATVERALEIAGNATYRIRFRASREGPDARSLKLTANGVSATATYTSPAKDDATPGRQLAGLYLEIEYPTGGPRLTRRLAGFELARLPRGGITRLDNILAEDVRAGLFGKWALTIDGGAPSASQLLEQLFLHRLSMRGMFEAETTGEFFEAMGKVQPMSEHAQLFSLPLVGEHAERVFEQGARFWLETDRRTVTKDGEFAVTAVDLLPFTRFDAVITDPAEALAATAAASATLALIEQQAFETSALSVLAAAGELGFDNIRDRDIAMRLRGTHRGFAFLGPAKGAQQAFWAIDPRSGSLLPVLEDGSGGGLTVARVESTWRTIDKALELAGVIDGVPTSITLWAQLERAKIAKLANSTIAILTMGTEDFSPPEAPNFEDVECEVIQRAVDGGVDHFLGDSAAGEILTYIGKLNDWGEFTGFGGTGIPTSLPVCP